MTCLVFFALAAVLCTVIGFGVFATTVDAQAMPVPEAELPEGVKNAGQFAPVGWAPGQPHPGERLFSTCAACHTLSTKKTVGPGFAGLYERVAATQFEGKAVQQRLLEYIKDVKGVKDPYFLEMQKKEGPTPNVDMTPRGGLADTITDRQILDIIDYILRNRVRDFDEAAYMKKVRLGREFVTGARHFSNGGPSCIGCHTVGADDQLRGGNVGKNISHTLVAARTNGGEEKDMYAQGLFNLLSGENAPRMHRYYRDGVGHLTDSELEAVMTFFDYQMRQVGTERESNYLPIFALLLAALFILLMEPGLYANLFAKEEEAEFIDGPYEPEVHHHDEDHEADHGGGYGHKPEAPKAEAPVAAEEPKPQAPSDTASSAGAEGTTENKPEAATEEKTEQKTEDKAPDKPEEKQE
ncbi:MAG: c-type cytochrome [Planctomycetes bacterium]|nr:c-type cytochrome [Planctomycetota bacterium]